MSRETAEGAGRPARALAGAPIRVVANRTGISPDTLRVWERRYGFPRPLRTSGGTRVYLESDVERLHLIALAVHVGFRPGEVVNLEQADLVKLVDASMVDAGLEQAGPRRKIRRDATSVDAPAPALPTVDSVMASLMSDDIVGFRSLLRVAALALGSSAFVTELAHPFAVLVGDRWASGRLDVRHEHIATACLTSQLHCLRSALDDIEESPTVVMATLPGDTHALGIEMVAVQLAANRAAPRVLGADTPPEQIVEAARALGASAVGLSISASSALRSASRAALWLAEALPPNVELWLGGGGASAVAPAVPEAILVSTWLNLDTALTALRAKQTPR